MPDFIESDESVVDTKHCVYGAAKATLPTIKWGLRNAMAVFPALWTRFRHLSRRGVTKQRIRQRLTLRLSNS